MRIEVQVPSGDDQRERPRATRRGAAQQVGVVGVGDVLVQIDVQADHLRGPREGEGGWVRGRLRLAVIVDAEYLRDCTLRHVTRLRVGGRGWNAQARDSSEERGLRLG